MKVKVNQAVENKKKTKLQEIEDNSLVVMSLKNLIEK